jgi:signal transduction histidine kinase
VVARLEPSARPAAVGLDDRFRFIRRLIGAGSPDAAVAEATRYCSARTGHPSAGWVADPDRNRLSLVSVEGAPVRAARKLRKALPVLRRKRGRLPWSAAGGAFARATGFEAFAVLDGGEAVVMYAGSAGEDRIDLKELGRLLGDVVANLKEVGRARRRNQDLDLGIALTAHEVRGPALAACAAIESALSGGVEPQEARGLLTRSVRELRSLGAVAESMLKWAVAAEPIRRRPTDLVALVREAVAESRTDDDPPDVRISAPSRLTIGADRSHLRTAVANVVRNALSFSPPERDVVVRVERTNGIASVIVEDMGPGIPAEEQDAIFDPFVRGRGAARSRYGKGLGLFIAQRVVQAHQGAIWLEGGSVGARFHIDLPVE